jgi:hypothetical protein
VGNISEYIAFSFLYVKEIRNMEQQTQSDSQGSMSFGRVDPPANQIIVNDDPDNCQSSTGISMSLSLKNEQKNLFIF